MTEFIYPFFDNTTHQINREEATNNIDYPLKNNTNTDYELPLNLNVCIIREGVGFKCQWSQVKVVDQAYSMHEIFNKVIYVKSSFLTGIDIAKKSLTVYNGKKNQIDLYAAEINDSTREAFVPYLDQKNGLYCVKLEMEYEKFIDNVLFLNSLKKAHREGIRIILESRGARSDDGYIDALINDYYTFGYVLKTPDILSIRPCVPVRFTVGVPLVFLNNLEDTTEEEPVTQNEIKYRLELNNRTIVDIASTIVFALGTRRSQIESLTYPLKFLENFIYEYEVSLVPKFVNTFNDLLDNINRPPKSTAFQEYTIMLSEGLDILKILIYDNGAEYSVPNTVLKQFEFSKDCFTNKRLINYYLNYKSMREDALNESIGIVEFIEKYIKYPTPKLNENIEITPRISIPREKAKEYDDYFKAQQESCTNITVKDVLSNDPMYHLFVSSIHNTVPETQETLSSVINKAKDIFANVDRNAENTVDIINFKPILDSMGVSSTLVPPDQVLTTEVDKKTGIAKNATKKIKSVQKAFIIAMNVLDRINLVKVIFEWYLCRLMQGDPNDVKTAELIKKYLTPQMIGYLINILDNDLTSKDVLFKIANNLPFDLDLFCVKNKELAYFLKAILSGNIQFGEFSIPINIQNGSFSIDFQKPFKDKINGMIKARESTRTTNNQFYRNLLGSIITNVLTELVKRLMGYLETFLTSDCPDSNLNLIPDQNILNTANPVGGFAGSSSALDTSDPTNPKNKDLANATIPVRYDIDPDGAINLLSKLLNDLSCVLTPIEVCEALEGNITAESMMLAKSLIRRKYLPDLEEMLSESNIRFLFDQLGKRIDPNVCAQIRRATAETIKNITNTISNDPNTINALLIECDPIINKNRSRILDEKGDNPIIDQKKQKNKKNNDDISKLFDSGFNDPIDVSLFCDLEGNLQLDTSQFDDYINELLINLKYKFNEEAALMPSNFVETKNYILKGENNQITNTIEYKSPYDSLIKTTQDGRFLTNRDLLSIYYNENEWNYIQGEYKHLPTGSGLQQLPDVFSKLQSYSNMSNYTLKLKNECVGRMANIRVNNFLNNNNPKESDTFAAIVARGGKKTIDFNADDCEDKSYENVFDAIMSKIPAVVEVLNTDSKSFFLDEYKLDDGSPFTLNMMLKERQKALVGEAADYSFIYLSDVGQAINFENFNYILVFTYKSTSGVGNPDKLILSLKQNLGNNSFRDFVNPVEIKIPDENGNIDVWDHFYDYYSSIPKLDIPVDDKRILGDGKESSDTAKDKYKNLQKLFYTHLMQELHFVDTDGNKINPQEPGFHAVQFFPQPPILAGGGGYTPSRTESYIWFRRTDDLYKALRQRWGVWEKLRENFLNFVKSSQLNSIFDADKFKKALSIFDRLSSSPVYSAKYSAFSSYGIDYKNLLLDEVVYNPTITGGGTSLTYSINKKVYPSSLYFERFLFIDNIDLSDLNYINNVTAVLEETSFSTEPSVKRKAYETEDEYLKRVENAKKSLYLNYYGENPGIIYPSKLRENIFNINSKQDESIKNIGNMFEDIYSALLNDSIYSSFDLNNGLAKKINLPNSIVIEEKSIYDLGQGKFVDGTDDKNTNNSSTAGLMQQSNKATSVINAINLNLSQTLQEQTCKIFPHYFNDIAWRNDFNNNLNASLCDGKPEAFPEETLKIIVKLIFRVFIAEVMSRAEHKFVYYTKSDIKDLIKDKDFKKIIREAFYRELDEHSTEFMVSFYNIVKYFYKNLEENTKLDNSLEKLEEKYIETQDIDNKEINYFITKEIVYYFTILNKVIGALPDKEEYNSFKEYRNTKSRYFSASTDKPEKIGFYLDIKSDVVVLKFIGISGSEYSLFSWDKDTANSRKYIEDFEQYIEIFLKIFGMKQANLLGLHYLLNYFKFDKQTRNNFKSIKGELIELFIKYARLTVEQSGDKTELATFDDLVSSVEQKSAELGLPLGKLRDYMDEMSTASNPSIMLYKHKHLAFQGGQKVLLNLLQSSLKLTKSALEATDIASFLSKMIMKILTTSIQLPWFLSMQEQDRLAAIASAQYNVAKLMTRLELGMPLLPEGIIGLGFAASQLLGAPYDNFKTTMWIAADFALEYIEYPEFYKKFIEIRTKYRNPNKEDKCETDNVTGEQIIESIKCNADIHSKIIDNYKFLEYHTVEFLLNPPKEPKEKKKFPLVIKSEVLQDRYDISKRFIGDLNKNS